MQGYHFVVDVLLEILVLMYVWYYLLYAKGTDAPISIGVIMYAVYMTPLFESSNPHVKDSCIEVTLYILHSLYLMALLFSRHHD